MGLQLKRTPLLLTQLLLGVSAVAILAAPPLVNLVTSKNAVASETPDISKIHFASASRYVRENDASDIAARLITYNATTDVNFYVDGNVTPVAGVDAGTSGKNNHQWRLYTALPAGEHTITATVQIGGAWYEVAGQATAYSLGMPDASYVLPSVTSRIFRPADTPIRLKIEDTFDQFKEASFSIYTYDTVAKKFGKHVGVFKVGRDACDVSAAGSYVLCDVTAADGWAPLSDGETYAVKLATTTMAGSGIRMNMPDYWTTFTVDGSAPVIDDFTIVGSTTVGDTVSVAAKATDSHPDSVDFYVTRPTDDGLCTGEGEKITEKRVQATTPGNFSAVLDVSASHIASGKYCVSAVARDEALNISLPSSLVFMIDHTAPVATLQITSSHTPTASTPVTIQGTVDGAADLDLFADGAKVDGFTLVMIGAGQWSYRFDNGFDKGTHSLKIIATDAYGNSSTEVTSPLSFATIGVGAYVPPASVRHLPSSLMPPQLLHTPVTPVLPSAQIVASRPASDVPKADDGAILGAQTKKDSPETATVSAPIAPSSNGWTLFGIAWYWWALLTALFVGGGGWIAANLKRQRQFA